MAVRAARGEDIVIGGIFKGFNYFLTSWVLLFLQGLATGIGFAFFIIPGIFLLFVLQYDVGKSNLGFTVPFMAIAFSVATLRLRGEVPVREGAAPGKEDASLYQLLNELIGIEIEGRKLQEENQKKIAEMHDRVVELLNEKRESNEHVLDGIGRLEGALRDEK